MYRKAHRHVAQHSNRRRRYGSVTISGLTAAGILFLGPSTAVANADFAAPVNWDAVAQCESGGNWHADTGNGFYGGLQFKESTWHQFGGIGSPAKAPRAAQIAVANRVLAAQGPSAWPKCGAGNMQAPNLPTLWQKPLRTLTKTLWAALPH